MKVYKITIKMPENQIIQVSKGYVDDGCWEGFGRQVKVTITGEKTRYYVLPLFSTNRELINFATDIIIEKIEDVE